jgi:hypothetical protein
MSTVYKYCSNRGVDILNNLELKITPANQFNDPFEFTPHIICSDLEGEARSLFEPQDTAFFNARYLEDKASGKFTGSFPEFINNLSNHI